MEAAQVPHERARARGGAPGGPGGPGPRARGPHRGGRGDGRRRPALRGRHRPLEGGHHHPEVRRHRERGELQDARVLRPVSQVHRQRDTHVRGHADAAGVRPHHGWEGGAYRGRQGDGRVQPAMQVRPAHGGTDRGRAADRPPQVPAAVMLHVMPGAGGLHGPAHAGVLLRVDRRVPLPRRGGGRDRRGHREGVPRRTRRDEGDIRCLHGQG